jgi:hypothetical protein
MNLEQGLLPITYHVLTLHFVFMMNEIVNHLADPVLGNIAVRFVCVKKWDHSPISTSTLNKTGSEFPNMIDNSQVSLFPIREILDHARHSPNVTLLVYLRLSSR